MLLSPRSRRLAGGNVFDFLVTNGRRRYNQTAGTHFWCNSLSNAPNSSCGSRCLPIAFDTPTSDSNRVAADSRDPSRNFFRSHPINPQTPSSLKRWMSQILGTLQTEKRPPLQPQNCASEADACFELARWACTARHSPGDVPSPMLKCAKVLLTATKRAIYALETPQ